MAAPDYHRLDAAKLRADRVRLAEIPALIEAKLARWEELEQRAAR